VNIREAQNLLSNQRSATKTNRIDSNIARLVPLYGLAAVWKAAAAAAGVSAKSFRKSAYASLAVVELSDTASRISVRPPFCW